LTTTGRHRDPDLVTLDPLLAAVLRSPTRQHILRVAQQPVTARAVADSLGLPVTRVYHHLERLAAAGLLSVVGQEKDGAAVSQVFQAQVTDVAARADLDQLAAFVHDSIADVRAAEPGSPTLVGKTIGTVSAAAVGRLITAVEQALADFDAANEPDGDLVAFTYLVAPVQVARDAYQIRPGTADDLPIVRRVLDEALRWHPERVLPPMEQLLDHPEVTRFHRGWGRPGDLLVVAYQAGEPVGGAFARLFTDEDHGSGYVDARTPEVAVAVWPEHRGRGIGARLLAALAAHARTQGITRLSLAVERENPATHLYLRQGYRIVGEPGRDYLMLRDT
jgi:GNAT superfamily N-acetyltransferase